MNPFHLRWTIAGAAVAALVIAQVVPAAAATSQDLANQILSRPSITLATVHASGVRDHATAKDNLVDTGAGRPAQRSCYQTAPCGTHGLDARMLQGMLDLTDRDKFTFSVSEVAGGSHHTGSRHYLGVAFDVNVINGAHVAPGQATVNRLMNGCRQSGATQVLFEVNHVHCGW
jgi:hypothetical protein